MSTPKLQSVSNRHFAAALTGWGWMKDERKSDGEKWVMTWPATNQRFDIVAPGYHKVNQYKDVVAMIELTMSQAISVEVAQAFWGHVPSNEAEAKPEPEITESELKELPLEERKKRVKGVTADVLQALINNGSSPLTIKKMQQIVTQAPGNTVSNAMSYLCRIGLAERVMRGTYRAIPDLLPHTSRVRHDHAGGAAMKYDIHQDSPMQHQVVGAKLMIETEKPVFAADLIPDPSSTPSTPASLGLLPPAVDAVTIGGLTVTNFKMTEIPDPPKPTVTVSDDIDAVLDMLCPDGFQLTNTSDLQALLDWRTVTAELIKRIRR